MSAGTTAGNDSAPWWTRGIPQAIASLVLGLLSVVGLAWLSLAFEYPPSGDACDFQYPGESAPSAQTGTESIDWNVGLFPERVCELEVDGSTEVYSRRDESLFGFLWPFIVVAVAFGSFVAFRVVTRMARRLSRSVDATS